MSFDDAAKREISEVATGLGVEPEALMAVAEVESGGRTTYSVDGKDVPAIRWEGHYFWRLLPEERRAEAVRRRLASPHAQAIPNPKGMAGRYGLLDRAKSIDEAAALGSCSWGLGQVMGANWKELGYPTVHALVDDAMAGVGGQVRVMAAFIKRNGLVDELQRHDWAGFARRYNGPNYRKFKYDEKMAAAYRKFSGKESAPQDHALLRIGSDGILVRELQTLLRQAGFTLHVDGDFGPATQRTVRAFQAENGLTVDGIVGASTWAMLEALKGVDERG
ncbi:MAG: N-acetylmuramidase domain-containing protein [Pseudomonadota bacterium]